MDAIRAEIANQQLKHEYGPVKQTTTQNTYMVWRHSRTENLDIDA
jgi:hypothetical protein